MAAASFRGIPFFVSSTEGSFGRRIVDHEFPGKDVPYLEDLGESIQGFQVDGYVIGDDVNTQRNRIIEASRKEGIGELIHPTFGVLNVRLRGVKVSEVNTEDRIARFQFTFTEATAQSFPTTDTSPQGKTEAQAKLASVEVKNAFDRAYDYLGATYAQSQSVLDTLTQGLLKIGDAKALVASNADYRAILKEISDAPLKFLNSATALADQIFKLVTFGFFSDDPNRDPAINTQSQFRDVVKLFDFVPVIAATSTSATALTAMFSHTAIIGSSALLAQITFESSNQAHEFRDVVINKIDAMLLETTDDALYSALWDMRTALSQDIEFRATDLSLLTSQTINEATPALVISNALYGSVDQEQDIIGRNKVKHPGFISGPIEVLLNAG